MGGKSSGKTCLLLSMLSALQGRIVLTYPGLLMGDTVQTAAVPLDQRVTAIDTWGILRDNYAAKDMEFRFLLNGFMPVPQSCKTSARVSAEAHVKAKQLLAAGMKSTLRPDVVFFTITPALLEERWYLDRLHEFISIMRIERPG